MFQLKSTGIASIHDKALARIKAGYPFPEMPETNDQWTPEFNSFVEQCRSELQQKLTDHRMFQNSVEHSLGYVYASDTVSLFNRAAEAQDMELVRIYHRLIQAVENPNEILSAVNLMRSMSHSTPIHETISNNHLIAMREIENAQYWARDESPLDDTEDGKVIVLAFNDLSLTHHIVMLLKRGITTSNEIQNMLKETVNIEAPLMDGTL